MNVNVQFHSYFKDLTGCAQTSETLGENSTLHDLYRQVCVHFPNLTALEKSTLMAVGVDYQTRDYVLKEGDEVSFFPPVQGG